MATRCTPRITLASTTGLPSQALFDPVTPWAVRRCGPVTECSAHFWSVGVELTRSGGRFER